MRTRQFVLVAVAGLMAVVGNLVPAQANQACEPDVVRYVDQQPAVFAQLGIERAWSLSRGNGVRVAVVDSGVAANNAHLKDAVDPGLDLVASGDGRVDVYSHGTALAGQIASRQVRGSGLEGVAPGTRIVPVRVYEAWDDRTVRPDPARTAQGIRWAADQAGVRVILVAMATKQDVPALRTAVEYAASKGVLVVASAGNIEADGKRDVAVYPAAYPSVLSVTAVGNDGQPSRELLQGAHVDVAAPGQSVLTTFLSAGDCVIADRPSSSWAAGYVAGVAALVASRFPRETPADWTYRLTATAMRPAASTRSPLIGWGVVAPWDALNFVNDGTLAGPTNPRFPHPTPEPPAFVPQPTPEPNHAPVVQAALALVGLVVATIVVGGLLILRMRRDPD